jgi:hypothetical protein
MAETEPQAGAEEDTGRHWGGLILDIAGIAAGVILLLIVADIWMDGRLTRRLASRAQPPAEQEGAPGDAGQS